MKESTLETQVQPAPPPLRTSDPVVPATESVLPLWSRRFIGAAALRACPSARKPCTKVNCWVQPFCACARADWSAAKKTEGRVWALIAGCGALVLVIALARAFFFRA